MSSIHHYQLNQNGGFEEISNDATNHWTHLNFSKTEARNWLRAQSKFSPLSRKILKDPDTRPRFINADDGALLCLRGLNFNPESDLEDMTSLRMWITEQQLVTSNARPNNSIKQTIKKLEKNVGAKSIPELVLDFILTQMQDFDSFVHDTDQKLDSKEDQITESTETFRLPEISAIRRRLATIKRYLSPQKEALMALYRARLPVFDEDQQDLLLVQVDKISHVLESLDLLKERCLVLQEQYIAHLSQIQNNRLYILAIISAVFLPLTFLSGLLGMNVGGIPGLDYPFAFLIVVVMSVAVTVLMLIWFRKKKWI